MTAARDIMTSDPTFCDESATVADAARLMAEEDLGAVPVCNGEGRLCGVVTDRDLALRVVAEGRSPDTPLSALVDGREVVTIGADDSTAEAMRTMKEHAVRRLPVIDGNRLVGMLSQADLARAMPNAKVGDMVGAISMAPPSS